VVGGGEEEEGDSIADRDLLLDQVDGDDLVLLAGGHLHEVLALLLERDLYPHPVPPAQIRERDLVHAKSINCLDNSDLFHYRGKSNSKKHNFMA